MADTKPQENLESNASLIARIAGPQPEQASFGEVFSAQRRDERFGHAAIDQLLNGSELREQDAAETKARGGWDFATELDKATSGLDPEDADFLAENGRNGPASMRKAQARLALRKDTDRTVARAGVWTARVAASTVQLTNPAMMLCAAAGWLVVRRLALSRSAELSNRPFIDQLAARWGRVKARGRARGIDHLDSRRQPSQTAIAVGPSLAADGPGHGHAPEDSGPEQSRAGPQLAGRISGGDWAMAALSFLLTPLAPILLSIYNFARSRRAQGLLYLGVLSAQCALLAVQFAAR